MARGCLLPGVEPRSKVMGYPLFTSSREGVFSETQGLEKVDELRCPRRLLVLPLDYTIGSSRVREEG